MATLPFRTECGREPPWVLPTFPLLYYLVACRVNGNKRILGALCSTLGLQLACSLSGMALRKAPGPPQAAAPGSMACREHTHLERVCVSHLPALQPLSHEFREQSWGDGERMDHT